MLFRSPFAMGRGVGSVGSSRHTAKYPDIRIGGYRNIFASSVRLFQTLRGKGRHRLRAAMTAGERRVHRSRACLCCAFFAPSEAPHRSLRRCRTWGHTRPPLTKRDPKLPIWPIRLAHRNIACGHVSRGEDVGQLALPSAVSIRLRHTGR